MRFFRISSILFYLFLCSILNAQSVDWLLTYGNEFTNYSTNITIDEEGSNYVTGLFAGDVDFNPEEANGNLSSKTELSLFLLKLDKSGNYLWSVEIDSSYKQVTSKTGITLDENGRVIIHYPVNMDDKSSLRLKMFSQNGEEIWSRDIYLYGSHNNDLPKIIEETFLVMNCSCQQGDYKNPISLMNVNGDCLSTIDTNQEIGSIKYQNYEVSNGTHKIIGEVEGTVDFIFPDAEVITIGEGNVENEVGFRKSTFLATLNDDGSSESVILLNDGFIKSDDAGNNYSISNSEFDQNGNLYLQGNASGQIDYGTQANIQSFESDGFTNGTLAKYNNTGELLWLQSWENTIYCSEMRIDADGNIILSLDLYYGEFDVNPQDDVHLETNSTFGVPRLCLVSLDKNADYLWSRLYGFMSGYMDVDTNGDIVIAGIYNDNFNLPFANDSVNVVNRGESDGYIMKVLNGNGLSSIIDQSYHQELIVSPNPSSGIFYLNNKDFTSLDIYNQTGQQVKKIEVPSNEGLIKFDITHLENGMYYLVTKNDEANFSSILVLNK